MTVRSNLEVLDEFLSAIRTDPSGRARHVISQRDRAHWRS